MQTGAKVALICGFGIVLAGVIVVVAKSNSHPRQAAADTSSGSVSASRPAAAAPVAPGSGQTLASAAPGSGGVGGPSIVPPGSPSDRIGAASMPAPGAAAGAPVGGATTSTPAGGLPVGAPGMTSSPLDTGMGAPSTGTPRTGSTGLGAGLGTTPGASSGSSSGAFPYSGSTGTGSSGFGTGTGSSSFGSGTGSSSFGSGSSFGTGSSSFGGMTSSAGPTTYKIQKGDMLGVIAKKYSVTVEAIKTANPGIDPNRLKVNSEIKIPAPSPVAASTRTATTRPAAGTTATTRPASATPTAAATIKPGSSYKVKKGDTLGTIAKAAYGNEKLWNRIFRANRGELANPNVVPVGMTLKIPQ